MGDCNGFRTCKKTITSVGRSTPVGPWKVSPYSTRRPQGITLVLTIIHPPPTSVHYTVGVKAGKDRNRRLDSPGVSLGWGWGGWSVWVGFGGWSFWGDWRCLVVLCGCLVFGWFVLVGLCGVVRWWVWSFWAWRVRRRFGPVRGGFAVAERVRCVLFVRWVARCRSRGGAWGSLRARWVGPPRGVWAGWLPGPRERWFWSGARRPLWLLVPPPRSV